MEALELTAEPRAVIGRQVKNLRRQGLVPAVLYGRGIEASPVQIEAKALTRVLDIAGTHQLISLKIGNQESRMTLVRDIQRDPIRRNYSHVDFYIVKMDEKVTASVPVLLVGVSPAVRDLDGILTQGLDQIEIECLPGDLIASIEVDISSLTELNDTITVSDLKTPETLTVLSDPDSVVVKIEPPRLAEEVEEEEAEVSAEPEVVRARREEEEEE
jgi:large subunit ribosomal protein L25